MRLVVTRKDIEAVVGGFQAGELLGEHAAGELLGGEAQDAFFDELPKVIVWKLRRMIPEGFGLREVEMEFEVEGNFGIGRACGTVTARFSAKE